jgi:hypothetical protein
VVVGNKRRKERVLVALLKTSEEEEEREREREREV